MRFGKDEPIGATCPRCHGPIRPYWIACPQCALPLGGESGTSPASPQEVRQGDDFPSLPDEVRCQPRSDHATDPQRYAELESMCHMAQQMESLAIASLVTNRN